MSLTNLPRGRRAALLASCLICLSPLFPGPTAANTASDGPDSASLHSAKPSAARQIVRSLNDPILRAYLGEVLDGNPELEALHSRAEAMEHRPAQVGALPDPMLQTSLFALPPETRVGPQRLQVGVQQRLPSKARRGLKRDAAELGVLVADAEIRAAELRLVTGARELWLELAFVDTLREILREERGHLERHEEAARARYAAGTGLAQGAIKIQAELTRVDAEILGVESRRQGLVARLDALRDDFGCVFEVGGGQDLAVVSKLPGMDVLVDTALTSRPEIHAAKVRQEQAQIGERLAETSKKPDFTVGLTWTLVENRQDDAGRLNPPEDNGRDVLALVGGMNLPLWSAPREAELSEALARAGAAAADTRRVAAEIRRQVTDLAHRLPLEIRQLNLLRDVLERQAEEAVTSVVSAYSTGQTGALDLLDAEHRLFEVRRGVARAKTDVAIALAQLEGAIARPLDSVPRIEPSTVPSTGKAGAHD